MREEKGRPIKYVPLRTLPSRLYALMLKEALAKHKIPSIVKGDDVGIMLGSYSTTSPVEVSIWVPEKDKKRCEEIADQMFDHI